MTGLIPLEAHKQTILPLTVTDEHDLGYCFTVSIPPKDAEDPDWSMVSRIVIQLIFYSVSLSDPTDKKRVVAHMPFALDEMSYNEGNEAVEVGYYPKEEDREIKKDTEGTTAVIYFFEKRK